MSDHFDAIKKMRDTEDIDVDNKEIRTEEESQDINESPTKQEEDTFKIGEEQNIIGNKIEKESKFEKLKKQLKIYDIKIIYVISIILAVLFVLAIKSYFLTDKFQIYAKNGELYRINKVSGQLSLINETRLVAIDEPNKMDELGLNKLKEWDKVHITQLDGIDLNLKTNWRNNKIYYQLRVSPYTKRLKNIREGNDITNIYKAFTIKLQDENGFDVLKITAPINEMTGATDEKNKIFGLSKNDSIECNYDDFKAIKNWTVEWNL